MRQFLLIGNSDITAHTRYARWFLESLSVLGVVAVGIAGYSLFRPIIFRYGCCPTKIPGQSHPEAARALTL